MLGSLVLGSVLWLTRVHRVCWVAGWTGDGPTHQVSGHVLFLLKRKERLCCALAGARSAAERAPKCTRTKRTGSGRRGSSRVRTVLLEPGRPGGPASNADAVSDSDEP